MGEQGAGAAVGGAEQVGALAIDQALVDVHGAAGLLLHRFGHEGGKDAVAQRRLAHRALEQKDTVGQVHWFAVGEVDLHLTRTGLVDQRLHAQAVLLAEGRQFHEEGIEIVYGIDGVALAPGLGLAGAAQRRLQRHVRVLLARHQVELHLRRHHRLPALLLVERQHAAQHAAWRQLHGAAVPFLAVVDHHRHRLGGPGHHAHAARVGHAHHVGIGVTNEGRVVGLLAVHGIEQHALGQAHFAGGQEQVARQDLAARDAGHVGDHALDFVHMVGKQKFGQGLGHGCSSLGRDYRA